MHPFAADTAFQLASDRRQRLLDAADRRRRLRHRPLAAVRADDRSRTRSFHSTPPDAA